MGGYNCSTRILLIGLLTASAARAPYAAPRPVSAPARGSAARPSPAGLSACWGCPWTAGFEPEPGHPTAGFTLRGGGCRLRLTVRGADWVVPSRGRRNPEVVRVELVRGARRPAPEPDGREPWISNRLLGRDPVRWRRRIPSYASVRYPEVYPGVEQRFDAGSRTPEWLFRVEAGADPARIAFRIAGVRAVTLDRAGDLVGSTAGGRITLGAPRLYQWIDGRRRIVPGGFRRRGRDRFGFWTGSFDRSQPLVIDPALGYSTYLGGMNDDYAEAVAADRLGNVYVAGYTISDDFPTSPGAYQTRGSFVAFVVKLNPAGVPVYSTLLGAGENGGDQANAIAVDAAGDAYVAGTTGSPDFPTTTGAYQTALAGGDSDGFVTRLGPSGATLVYSTFVGSSARDFVNAIAIDGTGSAYLAGSTAAVATKAGYNVLVAKLNPTGTAAVYVEAFGGKTLDDGAQAIAVDAAGNAYVTGHTRSSDFPTTPGAYSRSFGSGSTYVQLPGNAGFDNPAPAQYVLLNSTDAFVTKLDAAGNRIYSTYLGGSGSEQGTGIAVDGGGNAYVTGATDSSAGDSGTLIPFPTTPGALQTKYAGGLHDAFVAKLNPSGSALVYSTLLGGGDEDLASGIAVDAAGDAYVAGQTYSVDFPTADAIQPTFAGSGISPNAFVAEVNAAGAALVYSTYLGGNENVTLGEQSGDRAAGVALDGLGGVAVAGTTLSADFPAVNATQPNRAGGQDLFIARIAPPATGPPAPRGDLNGDGRVTIDDALVALRIAIGLASPGPRQIAAGDLNGDGAIRIDDVVRILRIAVGLAA